MGPHKSFGEVYSRGQAKAAAAAKPARRKADKARKMKSKAKKARAAAPRGY
jgi:hypothetical protein